MQNSLLHIGYNTFRESLRQPIYSIILLTVLFIIAFQPLLALFTFGSQEKLVIDASMATIMLFGWIIAILCATQTVSREIESGTIALILVKPVHRHTFIIAKVGGILAVLTLFVCTSTAAMLIALKIAEFELRPNHKLLGAFFIAIIASAIIGGLHNYLNKTSFFSAFAKTLAISFILLAFTVFFIPVESHSHSTWAYGNEQSLRLLQSSFLMLFAVWAMGSLATALSTYFSIGSNVSICTVIFLLGLSSDYLHNRLNTLSYYQIIYMLHFWYIPVLFSISICWLLSAKQFYLRLHPQYKWWELHAIFMALSGVIIWRAIISINRQEVLAETNWIIKKVADIIFAMKGVIANVCHAFLPNWKLFWMGEALSTSKNIPWLYMLWIEVYIIVLISIFTLLAFLLFQSREIDKQRQN